MAKEVTKFLKVRRVKSPTRAYEFDAGIDFYVPEFDVHFVKDLKEKNPLVFGNKAEPYGANYNVPGVGVGAGGASITMSGSGGQVSWDLNDKNNTLIKFDEKNAENYFVLPPQSRIMLPSGIKSRMAKPGRALIAANKSGVATKHGLVYGAQVVDYTYKGEIHLSLINTSSSLVRIYENMKILQFVETPVIHNPVEVTTSYYEYPGPGKPGDPVSPKEEEFYKELQDDRGGDGFGSTDKK